MRIAAGKQLRAWVLLATFVASLGSSQLGAADHLLIDIACGEVGFSTDTDIARLGVPAQADSQHCVVCHFLRVARGANAASTTRLAVEDGPAIEFAGAYAVPPSVDPTALSSRGPPVISPIDLV